MCSSDSRERQERGSVDQAEEALYRAEQAAATILTQARAQAYKEAAGIRDEATAQAQQIIVHGEQSAAALLDQAYAELARLGEQVLEVIERVKAVAVTHAREMTVSEVMRLRQEAVEEADEIKAAIIDLARKEAQRVRSEADREKLAIIKDDAVAFRSEQSLDVGALPGADPNVRLLRASEIGSREFPVERLGFERESVSRWLKVVEASYFSLEEELHRARREWERVLDLLATTRS